VTQARKASVVGLAAEFDGRQRAPRAHRTELRGYLAGMALIKPPVALSSRERRGVRLLALGLIVLGIALTVLHAVSPSSVQGWQPWEGSVLGPGMIAFGLLELAYVRKSPRNDAPDRTPGPRW
jgi:hypothetical protein